MKNTMRRHDIVESVQSEYGSCDRKLFVSPANVHTRQMRRNKLK
ncbi:hypothetical protein ACI48J_05830 [Paenibacillus chitinolyticus]|nr:hypothetical protein [Paenibacillus chitinolyticus]MEC0247654.1 hypothetical protein [Paenibacillus chitinolyticus]